MSVVYLPAPKREDGLVRIYASAYVNHLSQPSDKWMQEFAPICGQRLVVGTWMFCDDMPVLPGERMCRRCDALADEVTA